MHTIVVPLRVLPANTGEGILRHVARCDGVLAAVLDEALVMRALAREDVTRADLLEALQDHVAPRGA